MIKHRPTRRSGVRPSDQLRAIRAMSPGDVLVLTHAFLRCGGNDHCSIATMASRENVWHAENQSDICYRVSHLPNGHVGVTCFDLSQY